MSATRARALTATAAVAVALTLAGCGGAGVDDGAAPQHSGSPPTALGYHRVVNPSASARWACSIILSGVAAPPLSPILMRRTLLGGLHDRRR